MNQEELPRWEHYCSDCVYLGRFKEYDLYYHPADGGSRVDETLLARYGNGGEAFHPRALCVGFRQPAHPSLVECLRRAAGAGYVDKCRHDQLLTS